MITIIQWVYTVRARAAARSHTATIALGPAPTPGEPEVAAWPSRSVTRESVREGRALLLLLASLIVSGMALLAADQEPNLNAPWPEAEKKGLWPKHGPNSSTNVNLNAPWPDAQK